MEHGCTGTHEDRTGAALAWRPGVMRIPPRPRLNQAEIKQLVRDPVRLNKRQRAIVEQDHEFSLD